MATCLAKWNRAALKETIGHDGRSTYLFAFAETKACKDISSKESRPRDQIERQCGLWTMRSEVADSPKRTSVLTRLRSRDE